MTEEKKFQSKDELEEWLKSRGANEKHSASAADMLSQKGITLSSELIGMSTQDLRDLGLDLIPANHLSNKLKDQPQQPGYKTEQYHQPKGHSVAPQQQQKNDMSWLQSELQSLRLEIHGVRETLPSVCLNWTCHYPVWGV